MARRLRFSHPWQPVEITARTIQGRFLLKPSKQLNALIAGIIAVARKQYDVRVYNFVFLSNHFHLLAAAASPRQLSCFMCFVLSNIAREAGRLHAWQGPFWGKRHSAIPIADDESLIDRMKYIFENGCKEGLATHPSRWGGLHAVNALTKGSSILGLWVDRTSMYRKSRKKDAPGNEEEYTTKHDLKLDTLPPWEDMHEEQKQRQAADLVAQAASAAPPASSKPDRSHATSRTQRGPHHRPSTIKRSCAPLCHAASKAMADAFRNAYQAFVTCYRSAAARLRERLSDLGFPSHAQVLTFAVLETG